MSDANSRGNKRANIDADTPEAAAAAAPVTARHNAGGAGAAPATARA